jgi:SAM-dependent methyltransferase
VITRGQQRTHSWQHELLRRVFVHQNGFAATTALATLDSVGALAQLRRTSVRAEELLAGLPSPWVLAASVVAACGADWLNMREDNGATVLRMSDSTATRLALDVFLDLHRAVRDAERGRDWSSGQFVDRLLDRLDVLDAAKQALRRRTSMPEAELDRHVRLLEGIVAVPLLPRLTERDDASVLPLLASLELGDRDCDVRRVMSFFAPMYGLAGSYAQALIRLPDLITGSEPLTPATITGSIDRPLNVRASAAAHTGYFHAANSLVTRLFDECPLAEQPSAIVDVGCGAGSWLRGLYHSIRNSTMRGRALAQYPLRLIGVDLDPAALEISRQTLRDLPATCVLGDVGAPDAIAGAVGTATGIDLEDALSVRAFVDHNRSLSDVAASDPRRTSFADGVYGIPSGSVANIEDVSEDWVAHYVRWAGTTGRHGLVVLEAHTLPVAEVSARLDSSHALALQYYHALSGQSPMPYERFRAAARSAGFESRTQALFPRSSPTTSVNWLVPSGRDGSA